ncbi:MAG: 6,7-dimethyl-8-ribityllumazine synthase [Bdellovibrionota bacterium]
MTLSESAKMLERWPQGWSLPKVQTLIEKRKPRIVILKTLWYPEVMDGLVASAKSYFTDAGFVPADLLVLDVPGSFELPLASEWAFEGVLEGQKGPADIVVALGCVLRGETPHFDFVCSAASQGLMNAQQKYKKALGFGVLTVDNLDQAIARRSKGTEAAQAALFMHLIRNPAVETFPWLGKV